MDGFDAWAAEHGLPRTIQVDGDEVVAETYRCPRCGERGGDHHRQCPDGIRARRADRFCDQGHPAHNARTGCGPCRDEELAGGGRRHYGDGRTR